MTEKWLREWRKEEEVWQLAKAEAARRLEQERLVELEEKKRRRKRVLVEGPSKRMRVALGILEFGEGKH